MNTLTEAPPFQTENFALALALHCAGIPCPEDTRNGKKVKLALIHIYDAGNLRAMGYEGLTLEAASRLAFEEGKHGQISFVFERLPILSDLLAVFDRERAIVPVRERIGARFIELARKSALNDMQENAVAAVVIALAMRKLIGVQEGPEMSMEAFKLQTLWLDTSDRSIADEINAVLAKAARGQCGDIETVSRLFATVIRARALLGEVWKSVEPLIRVRKPGQPQRINHGDGSHTMKMPGFSIVGLNDSEALKKEMGLI